MGKIASNIISVCLKDESAAQDDNQERYSILKDVVNEICNKWKPFVLDAIIFPAGFWHRKKYVGDKIFKIRKASIEKETFSKKAVEAANKLKAKGFGKPLIVAGVDSDGRSRPSGFDIKKTRYYNAARRVNKKPQKKIIYGDQLCVAWSNKGIVGIGRKIFPVQPDLPKDPEDFPHHYDVDAPYYVTYAKDFYDHKRVVKLDSGKKAILCACYDIFGCSEIRKQEKRTKMIEWIDDGSKDIIHVGKKKNIAKKYVSRFRNLIKYVDTGLVVIHSFGNAANSNYTERHGIATASAALGGGMVVGAAHFEQLPSNDTKATLASYNPTTLLKLIFGNFPQALSSM